MAQIIDKVANMSHAWLYGILFILVALPLVYPLGLGISVGTLERLAYNTIEATPDGSTVIYYNTFGTWVIDAVGPTRVLLEHMFRKDMKIIIVPHNAATITNTIKMLEEVPAAQDKVYGEDYIILTINIDDEVNHARFAADIQGTSPTESVYGNPVSMYPIMDGINTVADVALGIAKAEEGQPYIRQVIGVYGLKSVMVHGTDKIAVHASYVQAGIIEGAVDGIVAYAAYEKLIGLPGDASKQMDSLSLAVAYALFLLIVGNVNMVLKRRRTGASPQVSGGQRN